MRKKVFVILFLIFVLFAYGAISENEKTSGLFSYRLKGNGNAVITGFDWKTNGKSDIYVPQLIDGYTVTEIGSYAFSDKSREYSFEQNDVMLGYDVAVILPNTITKIGEKAFYYTKVLSVNIPSSIRLIEDGAFAGCRNILQFTVDSDNEIYTALDGVLYNKKEKELIAFPTNINRYLQSRSINNNRFIVPKGVRSISAYAFYDVNRTSAFVVLPNTVNSIGDAAFKYSSLSILPADKVGRYAYVLQSNPMIVLPNSVDEIGEYAFSWCRADGVNKLRVDLGNTKIIDVPACAFYLSSIDRIVLPKTLESIGESAFELFSSGNEKLVIPDNVKKIGSRALCNTRFEIVFGDNSLLNEIGDYAFYDSVISEREMFVLPSALKKIGDEAFCSETTVGFIKLSIPSSVKEIGNNICDRTRVTLSVEKDSYAFIWAEENGYIIDNTESDISWLND